jgi:hypothetical protein
MTRSNLSRYAAVCFPLFALLIILINSLPSAEMPLGRRGKTGSFVSINSAGIDFLLIKSNQETSDHNVTTQFERTLNVVFLTRFEERKTLRVSGSEQSADRLVGHAVVYTLRFFPLAVVTGVLPVAWMLRYIRRAMVGSPSDSLRCRRCGYDVRATRSRCPECGQVNPEANGMAE